MVQINKVKEHSPQEGKNKWLNLVFCSYASSVPRSEWDGGERWVVVLQRPFLSLLYRF
jgi:hypothetical protein